MNKEVLQAKTEVVNEIVQKAKDNKTMVIVTYHGLSVAQLTELRRLLKKENASLSVYKNSLVERAVDQLGYAELNDKLSGPNAFVFFEDAVQGLKVVAKYAKRHKDTFVIKAGVVEGKVVDEKTLVELSKLPGKEGLISMFLSVLQAPVRQFACAVKAVADAK